MGVPDYISSVILTEDDSRQVHAQTCITNVRAIDIMRALLRLVVCLTLQLKVNLLCFESRMDLPTIRNGVYYQAAFALGS